MKCQKLKIFEHVRKNQRFFQTKAKTKKEKQKITCKNCSSIDVIKKGLKKNKLQTKQRYLCKNCKALFTLGATKITYPINIILKALSTYNLGNSFQDTSKIINKKFKTSLTPKTIQLWRNNYKQYLPYSKIRNQCKKLRNPEEIVEKHEFLHNNLPYKFQYHKAKLDLIFKNIQYSNKFSNHSKFQTPIKEYLEKIPTDKFPHHIFKKHEKISKKFSVSRKLQSNFPGHLNSDVEITKLKNNNDNSIKNNNPKKIEQRASQIKFRHLKIKHLSKNNLANKLTNLALNLAKSNKDRHQAIQNFFLINDSVTIAVEIPVYLTNDDIIYFLSRGFQLQLINYPTPITGHIDLLQIRNGMLHILDYKPDTHKKEIQNQAIQQLTIYALALASRTKLALSDFKCAFFDENNYYEFFPLHTVYKKTSEMQGISERR